MLSKKVFLGDFPAILIQNKRRKRTFDSIASIPNSAYELAD